MSKRFKVLVAVYNISGYLMAELAALLAKSVEVTIIETPCRLSEAAHEVFHASFFAAGGTAKCVVGWRRHCMRRVSRQL